MVMLGICEYPAIDDSREEGGVSGLVEVAGEGLMREVTDLQVRNSSLKMSLSSSSRLNHLLRLPEMLVAPAAAASARLVEASSLTSLPLVRTCVNRACVMTCAAFAKNCCHSAHDFSLVRRWRLSMSTRLTDTMLSKFRISFLRASSSSEPLRLRLGSSPVAAAPAAEPSDDPLLT